MPGEWGIEISAGQINALLTVGNDFFAWFESVRTSREGYAPRTLRVSNRDTTAGIMTIRRDGRVAPERTVRP
jgi:hypothetical protein